MDEYTKYVFLKSTIEELFGSDAWNTLKVSNHIPTWRKYAIKTIKAIRVSVETTIEYYDEDWKKDFEQYIDYGISKIKKDRNIEEIIASLAATLIKVSFNFIGLVPQRKTQQGIPSFRKENWKLDSYRSVIYL
jgi:hypothetical protein